MEINLKGKTALVSGSTQGIGKASALELAKLGANIILLARNQEKLEKTLSELDQSQGQQHTYIVADFNEPEMVQDQIADLVERGQIVNILVNNTGGPAAGPITEAKPQEFIQAFNNHLINNHNIAALLLPGMKEAGYGRIINVISTSVKVPLHGLGVSNTIRAAVANWSKTLANEVGKFNITCNNVLPGATKTERLGAIISNRSNKTGTSQEEIAAEMTAEIPMKRFAEPEEIAQAVAFLASPAASYINGVNLPVDGGRTGSL